MITEVEDEGEIRTEYRKEMCSGAPLMATHAYEEPREPDRKGEPREPYRKGDRSTTMGHTRFQGEHT